MPPASRKSDVFALMAAPIYEMEKQLQDASRAARIEAQTAKDAAEAEALMAKARKPDQASEHLVTEASAARMLAEDIVVPPKPRLTAAGDITPEPLTHQLALHRCLDVLSLEGDLFDIIAGRYGARPNLGVFLKAHMGERLETDRITRTRRRIGCWVRRPPPDGGGGRRNGPGEAAISVRQPSTSAKSSAVQAYA